MRIRPLAALSVAALSALLLAGCSSAAPEATPTADATGADLCASAAPDGDVVGTITVGGEVGESATAEFTAPLEVESAERTVVVEGDGTAIADGDYVSYALAVFDASTGESLQEAGFGDAPLPAMPITIGSGADAYFGCATEGSRIAMTVPASGEGAAQIYVIDVLEVTPADEWCAVTEPGPDFPSVEFSGEGVPTVTIPDADAPADVQLEVLEEGDGDVVEPGDSVTVNYTGVKWSDGSVFDSSWESGTPATFTTTGVVTGFQRALEGQTVGSTVLVSMPPACGYGEAGSSEHELAGETLVFVVNIIEATRP
ncbi:FKBP-type peptidyl-prolyl cis-trans isomerase [Microbacterium sp. HJ5]